MHRLLRFVPFLALVVSPLAHANDDPACDEVTVATIAHWAGVTGKLISRNKPGGVLAATACKAMPNSPGTTIAAVAFDTNFDHADGEDGDHIKQVIALVQGGKVIAANRSFVEEDAATHFGSYRIDTAPYLLSPSVRAFGVVFDSDTVGPSCPDAAAEHELTLWVRKEDDLVPVFGTNLYGWVTVDNLSCGPGIEGARSESAHMTIAIERTSSHGFADLSLTAQITQTQLKKGNYVDTGKRIVRKVLKYDGTSYGVDMFRSFWYPSTSPMHSAGD
ncbi:multidrug ABC transporter ATPase [Burkholderia sp. SRS-W-2-2016]|uniref:hypothetical protein n=1 Tax=Burkholderia sp. SRS-W-2-2016 TaxID=1926878 RepID=UPI00094B1A14|nr:multidrug ABC transporter ATPase [Burkholderia sp. SRS-W-2-2016]OLL27365.1 multidrug ABC transporter ATPase [Burkholderia sp. SRS-W-2-2016]